MNDLLDTLNFILMIFHCMWQSFQAQARILFEETSIWLLALS